MILSMTDGFPELLYRQVNLRKLHNKVFVATGSGIVNKINVHLSLDYVRFEFQEHL